MKKALFTLSLATIMLASVSISYSQYIITQITDNSYDDVFPQINKNGYVVWKGWDGSDWEIFLYNGMNTIQITDNDYIDRFVKINDKGYVVWQGWDGSDWEIFLYNGMNTIQITDNDFDERFPQINDNGYVIWFGYDGSDWELFLYDGMNTIQITDNNYKDAFGQINNNGDVLWMARDGSDYEIFLASAFTNVTLLSPNGGEAIPSGSSYPIQWGAPLEAVSFKLMYSIDNGTTWKVIESGITGDSYPWTVPIPSANKKKSLIKVVGYDASHVKVGNDKSDAPFTIEVVKLESPNGEMTYTSGDSLTITWATNETIRPVAEVNLLFTKNGGITWEKIKPNPSGDTGTYDWTVPTVGKTKEKCKVKVKLKDTAGKTLGADASDDYFTILPL